VKLSGLKEESRGSTHASPGRYEPQRPAQSSWDTSTTLASIAFESNLNGRTDTNPENQKQGKKAGGRNKKMKKG